MSTELILCKWCKHCREKSSGSYHPKCKGSIIGDGDGGSSVCQCKCREIWKDRPDYRCPSIPKDSPLWAN